MALVVIVILVPVLAAVAWTIWASADIGSGVYVRALCHAPTNRAWLTPPKRVALTFDDGPHPVYTSQVLDILKRYEVKAAFFVVGKEAATHPEIVRRMVEEGHLVGNHTWSHSWRFPLMSRAKMAREIGRCDLEIERIVDVRTTFFRPPFGVTNPTLARALDDRHTVAGWSAHSLDTLAKWPRKRVFARLVRLMKPGSVVLLHDNREGADRLLEMILDHLLEEGYRIERFDEMFD